MVVVMSRVVLVVALKVMVTEVGDVVTWQCC